MAATAKGISRLYIASAVFGAVSTVLWVSAAVLAAKRAKEPEPEPESKDE